MNRQIQRARFWTDYEARCTERQSQAKAKAKELLRQAADLKDEAAEESKRDRATTQALVNEFDAESARLSAQQAKDKAFLKDHFKAEKVRLKAEAAYQAELDAELARERREKEEHERLARAAKIAEENRLQKERNQAAAAKVDAERAALEEADRARALANAPGRFAPGSFIAYDKPSDILKVEIEDDKLAKYAAEKRTRMTEYLEENKQKNREYDPAFAMAIHRELCKKYDIAV